LFIVDSKFGYLKTNIHPQRMDDWDNGKRKEGKVWVYRALVLLLLDPDRPNKKPTWHPPLSFGRWWWW
jgi:hypothetical protein